MNTAAFLLSALVLVIVLDRVRLINWRTTRPVAVLQCLFQAGSAAWVLWDSAAATVDLYQWLLLLLVAGRLYLTRRAWSQGMPQNIQTRPAPLGGPELERFK